jgi:hypothetical protein
LHVRVFARLRVERGAVIAEQPVLALAVLLELRECVSSAFEVRRTFITRSKHE